MPILLDDEYGYWANSSYFMGLDWSSITGNIAYYSYGYSLILLVLRMIAPWLDVGSWDGMYQLATNFNLLMLVAGFFIAVRLCRRYMKNMNWIVRCVACFVVMLYPANKIYSHITLSECALTFFLGISLYNVQGDRAAKLSESCGFCAGFSIYVYDTPEDACAVYNSHYHRAADSSAARKQAKAYSSVWGSHVCLSVLHSVIKQNLQNTLYMGKPPVGFAELVSYACTKKLYS